MGDTEMTTCQSAKDLLQQISAELAKFQAKDLEQFTKDLTDFVGKQDKLVTDYMTAFPDLRKSWCERQKEAETMYAQIRCEFPPGSAKWKEVIEDCICKMLHSLCCLGKRIADREYCAKGHHQRKRDAAQAAFDLANMKLQNWIGLTKGIGDALTAQAALATAILTTPVKDRPQVLYYFWFKFLPEHKRLAPYDASAECLKLGAEHDPNDLCKRVDEHPCHPDPHACECKDGGSKIDCSSIPKPFGPSLINPCEYSKVLDCAWQEYFKAKEALGEAESDFAKHQDDLASLHKKKDDLTTSLEQDIKTCLLKSSPTGDCCKEEPTDKGGC